MAQITIYKASAGSGKTWRLSVEFIKLLIKNPDSYRHILAVTFTNKATTEMKQRILKDLQALALADPKQDFAVLDTLQQELGLSRVTIADRAAEALSLLLHDYSRFRVETIDSFFQSILRNLARELGLGTAMNIELDVEEVLQEAVDLMIEKAGENKDLLQWIQDYIEENISEGRDRKVASALKSFGKTIFSESFQSREKELFRVLSDKAFLNNYRSQLYRIKAEATHKLKNMGQGFFNLIHSRDLSVDDFSNKSTGVAGYFVKLQKENFASGIVGQRVIKALHDPETWVTAKHPRRDEIIDLVEERLLPYLEDCEEERPTLFSIVYSCELSLKNIFKVGLLTDIAREVRALNREQNRFLLADTAMLLQTLISDSDASFVFEKIGSELKHIMIDEFQDTSRIQWANFRPLIAEGLSKNYDSLLVGDEKQSIYRWRNSDWRILGNLDREMNHTPLEIKTLEYNFRSETRIIQFNNALFERAVKISTDQLEKELGIDCPELALAYSAVEQLSRREQEQGLVKAVFVHNDQNYQERSRAQLVKQVEDLQSQGIRPDQIAILIRVKKHIPTIADYFAQHQAKHPESPYCYTIVSDDAFRLDASPAIQVLMAAFKLLADPLNGIAQVELEQSWKRVIQLIDPVSATELNEDLPSHFSKQLNSFIHIPLFELADRLIHLFDLNRIPAQESYLFSFMDRLQDFLEKNSSDLSGFLTYWEEHLAATTLPGSSGINGIRITTIHKAKGLQYHSVIAAFCDWSISGDPRDLIWCHSQTAPFSALPLIPVNYKQTMNFSIFKEDYQEEKIQLFIDNLNLLYVAFTRAEKNLLILSQANKPTDKLNKVSDLLYTILSDREHPWFTSHMQWVDLDETEGDSAALNLSSSQAIDSPDEKGQEGYKDAVFEYGSICTDSGRQDEESGAQDIQISYHTYPGRTKFRQSNRSRDFVLEKADETFSTAYIDRGKLLHRLFSYLRHAEDAPAAVRRLLIEGLIQEQQQEELLHYVREALKHPVAGQWFSGDYLLYNECSILYRDSDNMLNEKRPDRVIRRGDKVTVIDLKFGQSLTRYHKQVAHYMQLLSGMGHKQVEGYIWYVDEQVVEQVKSEEAAL